MVIQLWLQDVTAFAPPIVKTMAFPAVMDDDMSEAKTSFASLTGMSREPTHHNGLPHQGRSDLEQLTTALGRHFYQALYEELVPEPRPQPPLSPGFEDSTEIRRRWWWEDPAILTECREYGTTFEMVTFTCRKKCSIP
jgi:hypothetical protein